MYDLFFFLAERMERKKRFFVKIPAQFGAIIEMYATLQHTDWKYTKVQLANVNWKFISTAVTIPGFFSLAMALISKSLQKENFLDFRFTLEIGLRRILPKVKLNIS